MKKLCVLGATLATAAVVAAPGMAKVGGPGTPGEPNCFGQTMAYFAQQAGGIRHAVVDPHFIQQFKDTVRAFCEGG